MGDRVYNTYYFVPFIVLTKNIGPKALEWIDRLAKRSYLQEDKFKTFPSFLDSSPFPMLYPYVEPQPLFITRPIQWQEECRYSEPR